MVSLRFPFSFPQPNRPHNASTPPTFPTPAFALTASVAVGAAAFAGISAACNQNPVNELFQEALKSAFPTHFCNIPWASLSVGDTSASSSIVHSKTGLSFPSVIDDSRKLLGIGLRRKCILGLKNIDVYAFGVYADEEEVKKSIGGKYGNLPVNELKEKKNLKEEVIEGDFSMTVRLQIVYGKLSIRSVRSAFEESVGGRLQKFGGDDNKELLRRFTSQFKDEYKIPRGSVIDLSREKGYVLRTTIDGKEVGSIQSKILCKSILDLYIGDESFDKEAKEEVENKLASLIQKS